MIGQPSTEQDTSAHVNTFDEYFTMVRQCINRELPSNPEQHNRQDLHQQPNTTFQLKAVSIRTVKKVVRGMANKAGGRDGITAKLLKVSLPTMAASFTFLINSSLTCGVVPACWKEAVVVPVRKSGAKDEPRNFRPISLLPVVSKFTERIVHQQLVAYLESNELITPHQFGFRTGRSTEMALLTVTEPTLLSMESRKLSLLSLLDLSKAFDCVPHGQLLDSLSSLGILHPWFRSYLHGRTQTVKIGNALSEPVSVTCGVPQGSILGPLFFILYTNDIPDKMKLGTQHNAIVATYADDTQSLDQCVVRDLPEMIEGVGTNFEPARLSFSELKLKMNTSKTQGLLCGTTPMLSHMRDTLSLDIGGQTLQLETVVKDLGVHLNSNMTFGAHVDHIAQQMCGNLCFVSHIRHFLTLEATKLLVLVLVLSKLDYCSVVWGSINSTSVSKLQRAVNFAARVIYGARKSDHVTSLLQTLNWLTARNWLDLNTACFMYKVEHGMVPETLSNFFSILNEGSLKGMKQSNDF